MTADSYIGRCFSGGAYGVGGFGVADGFNYWIFDTGKALEWDCVAVNNGSPYGADAGLSCNGSSAHNGTIIRLGGVYGGMRSCGPAIADVTTASSLNLGVRCVPVLGGTDPTNQVLSLVTNTSGTVWLGSCLLEQGVQANTAINLRDTGIVKTGAGAVGTW